MKKRLLLYLMPILAMGSMAIRCVEDEGPDCHKRVYAANKSDIPIYVVLDYFRGWESHEFPLYQRVIEILKNASEESKQRRLLSPIETKEIFNVELQCLEREIQPYPGGARLEIYMIDAQKADELTTEEQLREHIQDIVLKAVKIQTFSELEQINFTITYP